MRDKVVVGVLTAIVLGGLALFANWASQGGLVHALGGISSKDLEETVQRLALAKLREEINDLRAGQVALEGKVKAVLATPTNATAIEKPTLTVKEVKFDPRPQGVENLEIELRGLIKKKCDGKNSCEFDITSTSIADRFPALNQVAISYLCTHLIAPSTEVGSKSAVLVLRCFF